MKDTLSKRYMPNILFVIGLDGLIRRSRIPAWEIGDVGQAIALNAATPPQP